MPILTSASDKRITVNSTYAFITNALQRNLGFNPGIFNAAKTNNEGSDLIFLLNVVPEIKIKVPTLPGIERGTAYFHTKMVDTSKLEYF